MIDNTQPEALRLSERISDVMCAAEKDARAIARAADELVRQHARIAELEAVGAGGVQALSAAPEAIAKLRHLYQNMVNGAVRDTASAKRIAEGLLAPAIEALERATPPAEQQATTTGAALEDVYAELPEPTASIGIDDAWHEAAMRDFADRTHALRMQAAPKAAPGVPIEIARAIRAVGLTLVKTTNGYSLLKLGKIEAQVEQPSCLQVKRDEWDALPLGAQRLLIAATKAAPQQEAKEPVMIYHGRCTIDCGEHGHHDMEMLRMIPSGSKLYTAPQPAPAELERLRERIARMGLDVDRAMRGHVNEQSPLGTQRLAAIAALVKPKPAPPSDDVVKDAARYRWLREGNDAKHGAAWHVAVNLYGCEWDAAIDAALAAQGGKV